ncbi:MAG: S26 family signal peptidase [Burkholderiales bacterium]|nr:S26 family signal peptidase [Burkholderiales bacterium]
MRYLFLKPPVLDRFVYAPFHHSLGKHVRRWGIACLLLIASAVQFQAHFGFGLNASPSLPQRLFLIHKGELPQRGDYAAFRWPGGGPYPAGVTFVKIVAGMAGDTVARADHDFFVNGTYVGQAKIVSREGVPLEPGPTGVLPAGRYYVRAPHPDSLDSRYRLTGWVSEEQIIGRAYALF